MCINQTQGLGVLIYLEIILLLDTTKVFELFHN